MHVHLIFEKKDFYFGSLSAVFDTLEEERIGIKKSTLLHAGLTDGSIKMTQRARIVVSHLIRGNLKPLLYCCLKAVVILVSVVS